MTDSDLLLGIEAIATAHNCSRRHLLATGLPAPDVMMVRFRAPAKMWRVSTIMEWSKDPIVAARCRAIAAALEKLPLKAG